MKLNRKNIAISGVVILLSVVTVFAYGNYSPTDGDMWFPQCPFKLLTGWSCPGCGIQRAIHAFLNRQWSEALSYNYFFVISVPYSIIVCMAYGLRKLHKADRISAIFEHRILAMIYVYCFFAWFIIRNILEI